MLVRKKVEASGEKKTLVSNGKTFPFQQTGRTKNFILLLPADVVPSLLKSGKIVGKYVSVCVFMCMSGNGKYEYCTRSTAHQN